MALTMSLVERVRVQRRIAQARASEPPVPWATLAQQEGIPERTLRHLHAEWIQVQAFYDDPLGVVGEALDTLTALMEETARDIQNAPPGNAKVGAMRVLLDVLVRRINLLVQTGRMPRNIVEFQEEPKMRRMIREFAEVIEKHDLPVAVIEDMLAVIEEERPKAA